MDETQTPPQLEGEIDLSIYPMPAFATLTVSDLAASRRWYVEAVGFRVLAEIPGTEGTPVLIHLRRLRYQDLLLRPGRPAPGAGVLLTFAAGYENLAERAAAAAKVGGGTVAGPAQTPWNTLDLTFTDPDGYRVVLTAYSPTPGSAITPELLRDAARRARESDHR